MGVGHNKVGFRLLGCLVVDPRITRRYSRLLMKTAEILKLHPSCLAGNVFEVGLLLLLLLLSECLTTAFSFSFFMLKMFCFDKLRLK